MTSTMTFMIGRARFFSIGLLTEVVRRRLVGVPSVRMGFLLIVLVVLMVRCIAVQVWSGDRYTVEDHQLFLGE